MNNLSSVESILKVFETGDKPVLVRGSDMQLHVVKHNSGQVISNRLFAELLVHQLLEQLQFAVFPASFFTVKDAHQLNNPMAQPVFFKGKTCFATRYSENVRELDQTLATPSFIHKIVNKNDLLFIAFLDLWLANEDRNWNNSNLMLEPNGNKFNLIPIDHGACFNSLSFHENNPLCCLTYDDSLISTDYFKLAVLSSVKTPQQFSDIAESYYLRIRSLEKTYHEIVATVPIDWHISSGYSEALCTNLFSNEWLNETKEAFLTFVTTSLHNT